MASAHGTGDHIISVQPEANGLSHVQPDYGWAVPLIKAMERGDWACFKTQLDLDSSVKSRRINSRGDTFLHLAIRDTGNVQFVRELVKEMSQEELELKNEMEGHALISAATGGIKEIAEIMLEKNSNLAGIPSGNGLLPIVRNGDKDIAEYLYSKTPLEQLDPEKMENGSRVVTDGARLVRAAIISDMYGNALKLVQQYPKLAIACEDRRWNAAIILAGRPCAFPSGCGHQFLEGLVYKGVSLLSGIQQETDSGSHGNKAQLSRMNQGQRELTGAVDLIDYFKLIPHHEFFCKRSRHLSVLDTHYLHNMVGETEIRKGEGMELDELVNYTSYKRETKSMLQPFDLDTLRGAFQLRETTPVDLPSSEKGIPTVAPKSRGGSKDKEKKHKKHRDSDKDKDKEHKRHKHCHKDKEHSKDKERERKKDKNEHSGADHSKKHHHKKRKHDGSEDVSAIHKHKNT